MPRIEQQRHKSSPAHGSNEAGTLTMEGEPLFRVDVHADLQTITTERSQEIGEPYAVWKNDDGRGKVLRIDPMTIPQMEAFRDGLSAAIAQARKAPR